MKFKLFLCAAVAVLMNLCTIACAAEGVPENFLYTGDGDLAGLQKILQRSDIGGAQVVYAWKSLEPREGEYDPKTGKRFTRDELTDFARDYLGADIVFWSAESPWLMK